MQGRFPFDPRGEVDIRQTTATKASCGGRLRQQQGWAGKRGWLRKQLRAAYYVLTIKRYTLLEEVRYRETEGAE